MYDTNYSERGKKLMDTVNIGSYNYRASLKTRLIKEKQIGMTAARKPSEGVLSHSKGG